MRNNRLSCVFLQGYNINKVLLFSISNKRIKKIWKFLKIFIIILPLKCKGVLWSYMKGRISKGFIILSFIVKKILNIF